MDQQSLKDRTEAYVKSLGLERSAKPLNDENVQMPLDPTKLAPKALQRAFTAMVAWNSYAGEQLTPVLIDLLEAENKLRRKKAEIRFRSSSEKLKWKLDDQVDIDPEVIKLSRKVERLMACKIALEQIYMNYDSKAKCLSREQTRRSSEYERSNRSL